MNHPYHSFAALLFCCFTSIAASAQTDDTQRGGGCIPPTAIFSNTAGDTARICQGDVISVNGASSTAAPGHSIEQWIWNYGVTAGDTSTIPFAILSFPNGGVHQLTLEVIDDLGCSSGPSAAIPVLVSSTPDFTTTNIPALLCEGTVLQLSATADQPLMIGAPPGCTAPDNGTPLVDVQSPPSTSTLQVSGQASGVITSVAQLGDICLEIEHSYMGDLVLSVTCPNGQSVILHQQGGGSTFLGDANDFDGNGTIVPGNCFQYCFGNNPEFGTLAASASSGATPNTVPVTQGNAIAPGRYTPVQPLSQLVGCPFNGAWVFSSNDNAGADNGYLCGWCISFGAEADSSFVQFGPTLGSSADSSFWSGPNVSNTVGQPGSATFSPVPGTQSVTYNVIDSYGCEHQVSSTTTIGAQPEVTIVENPELGLICAEVIGGPVTYQWSFQGQAVVGAAGACFTPPGAGSVGVTVQNTAGCSASDVLLATSLNGWHGFTNAPAFTVTPNPNNGSFTIRSFSIEASRAVLRVVDMTGRSVHERALGTLHDATTRSVQLDVAPGVYFVEVLGASERLSQRIVVE